MCLLALIPVLVAVSGSAANLEQNAPLKPAAAQHADYVLVWQDEFDGPKESPPNADKWAPRSLGPRRDAINVEEAARLDGKGHLLITTTRHVSAMQPAATQPSKPEYRTGMISTAGKLEATFGYFECRCRMQTQPGHWSAFWLQSPTMGKSIGDPAAAGVEIDVIEYLATPKYRDKALHTIHWDGYGKGPQDQTRQPTDRGPGRGFPHLRPGMDAGRVHLLCRRPRDRTLA